MQLHRFSHNTTRAARITIPWTYKIFQITHKRIHWIPNFAIITIPTHFVYIKMRGCTTNTETHSHRPKSIGSSSAQHPEALRNPESLYRFGKKYRFIVIYHSGDLSFHGRLAPMAKPHSNPVNAYRDAIEAHATSYPEAIQRVHAKLWQWPFVVSMLTKMKIV